jgi:flagellar assembly protein FliH
MRWFERGIADGAQRAKFVDVSQTQPRIPSWVPSRNDGERRGEPSLRPAKLPSEFVDAVRHELDQEYVAQARASLLPPDPNARRSERPPPSARQPSAAQNPQIVEVLEPQAATVDPALVQALEDAVLLLAGERERVLSETAGQIAQLAVLIARRVIGRELTLDPSLVRGLVREGIEALGQHDRVTIRLGTGFGQMQERIEQDLRSSVERLDVRFDPTLEVYGCLVETELGQVDESIESRLATLLQALTPDPEAA